MRKNLNAVNGFVFIPASSFGRDDSANENASIFAEDKYLMPQNAPTLALNSAQIRILQEVFDGGGGEATSGVDGVWIDAKTAVLWGLVQENEVINVNELIAEANKIEKEITQRIANINKANNIKSLKNKTSSPFRNKNIPKFTPPGYS